MPREQHPAERPHPDRPHTSVPASVLDLFAVPDDVRPLPGGQGHSVVAGDLVLSPGRDATTQAWLSPVLARLAVALDTEQPRGVRIAMPIPARDGSWVVDGWAASRYEPDTTACTDLGVLVATARLLHARLAVAVPERPAGLDARTDRWARADRLVQRGGAELRDAVAPYESETADQWVAELDHASRQGAPGPEQAQLVHGDLAGNVLLDARGIPVVIDVAPYWWPAPWAEALCVLDAVLWHGADPATLEPWQDPVRQGALQRAALFRLLSEAPGSPVVADLVRAFDSSPLRAL